MNIQKKILENKSMIILLIFLVVFSVYWFNPIDLSDQSKEDIVAGSISKRETLEISRDYINSKKIYAYKIEQRYVNMTISGKDVSNYVWYVELYLEPHFLSNAMYSALYVDINTGQVIECTNVVPK